MRIPARLVDMRIRTALAALLCYSFLTCTQSLGQSITALEAPERLSDWGLFEKRGDVLIPNDVVYDLNSGLFSDYASKLRTLRLPEGAHATINDGEIALPVGALLSKTFYYLRTATTAETERLSIHQDAHDAATASLDRSHVRLLETRLLVHTEAGWIALPYVWNTEQSDATLELAGESVALRLLEGRKHIDFDYLVPDANQCASCHAADGVTLEPIGLKTRHLSKTREVAGKLVNQLDHWRELGILDAHASAAAQANARWDDPHQPLEARARAYLDVNCSHCHGAQGAANHSGLWLTPDTRDPIQLGICKPPVATGRGSGDAAYVIVPGKPRDSILLHRMQSTEPDVAMPELGRSLVHKEGAALIEQWIRTGTAGTSRKRCS